MTASFRSFPLIRTAMSPYQVQWIARSNAAANLQTVADRFCHKLFPQVHCLFHGPAHRKMGCDSCGENTSRPVRVSSRYTWGPEFAEFMSVEKNIRGFVAVKMSTLNQNVLCAHLEYAAGRLFHVIDTTHAYSSECGSLIDIGRRKECERKQNTLKCDDSIRIHESRTGTRNHHRIHDKIWNRVSR